MPSAVPFGMAGMDEAGRDKIIKALINYPQ